MMAQPQMGKVCNYDVYWSVKFVPVQIFYILTYLYINTICCLLQISP